MQPIVSVWFRSAPWLAVLLLAVAGCANRHSIQTHLPEAPAFSESGDAETPERWWLVFDVPELDFQINQAFESNYSLAAAQQRVFAARALKRRAASDLFPDLDGVARIGNTFGPGEDQSTYQWGLDAGYRVDLWGEIQSRVDAQQLRADATCLDYKATALTLTSEIARTWFSLIEAHAQVELLDEQIETNRTGLILQESRFGLGLIRSADVLRQRQLLESTLEQAVVAEAKIKLLEHQLAVLLGSMPQAATYKPGSVLPELPTLPAAGLPSDLLHRRPDVRRNYLAFEAADRDLASAISAQYPRISLTGSLTNVAENPEDLFRDWFTSIGSQLIAPLLDGGQRRAEVERTSAVVRELFLGYAQTMLIAFREVEDSLVQEKYQLKRMVHLEEQVRLAGQASVQLREQYLIGDAEYLDVLSAITTQQSLQRQLLSAQLELVLIRVSLYLALSGGFEPTSEYAQDSLEGQNLDFESDESDETEESDFFLPDKTMPPSTQGSGPQSTSPSDNS
ncbi:MAG: multidrug efflux system outer membrane protein [Mariniblastus sp.]|jgi:multidrug efflux system outer membrane protein